MCRVDKPKSRLLILVPNAGFPGDWRLGLNGGTHQAAIRETVRSIAEWCGLFTNAGLEITDAWRDLHPLSRAWITNGPARQWPIRTAQASAFAVWPASWQYQVYFLCRVTRL